jgi:ribosomal protein S12 methylthiotransferase
MIGRLLAAGWEQTDDPARARTIIVNTCSFIESAADESIDTILTLARHKHSGSCRRLVVAGCLPERYGENTAGELPEVDVFLGTGAFDRIVDAAGPTGDATGCLLPDPDEIAIHEDVPRALSRGHAAYLKIAEGCSRRCTYCIIPKLRGRQKSRRAADILAEARQLISSGVKELTLVAQDTTAYGRDLPGSKGLAALLVDLADLDSDVWIRFLYGHPLSLTENIIRSVASRENICSYFDIPIQHAAAAVLKRMGRRYDDSGLRSLFKNIRAMVPGVALRTTVMVGFPGERESDFEALVDFVEEIRFDHLGVFTYSDGDDLPAHRLSGHIPAQQAQERMDLLMARQMEISHTNNQKYPGQRLKVLIEEQQSDDLFIGRSAFQAPEVDGMVTIHEAAKGPALAIGFFTHVRITNALDYDLLGEKER